MPGQLLTKGPHDGIAERLNCANHVLIGDRDLSGSMAKTDGWNAYMTRGDSGVGLVVVHEIYGFNNYLKSVSDQLAAAGYSAAAVDFYKGRTANSLEQGMAIRDSLRQEDILDAIRAGFKSLRASGAKTLGTLGFCMGGGFALLGACHLPETSFCVDYYGSIGNTEDVANLRGPVLLILGSEDARVTPWAYENFLPAAMKFKKRVEVQMYPEAKHAFHNNEGSNYNEKAAKEAWQRTTEFLSRMR